ncbi:TPA: ATP synthase F1 subunit epsilon [Candidatus Uhrbacteria bacterium]|nr:MAG: ATP synthase F1 subunit epsilon [Candidatus Uhrbacteria bacterium RIFCSPHIGHO2_02_FULL_54_11]HBL39115.1 ATP synthase F1 subunit epsilon [Candidatus Uhrbacteria bacterium]
MKKLKLKLVTPEKIVYEAQVDQVTAMTEAGEITILSGHIPLVATLRSGELRTKTDGHEELLVASTGFIEVRPGNEVVFLADTAERAEELDLKSIEEARERAARTLEEARNKEDVDFGALTAGLERELARHRVALKRKKYKDVGKV